MRRLRGKPEPTSPLPDDSPSRNEGPSSSDSPLINEGQVTDDGQASNEGLSLREGPARDNGPSKKIALAPQINGPLRFAGPVLDAGLDASLSVLASLPDVEGYLNLFHQVSDYLLPQLTPPEQAAYIQLYRLSWGYERSQDATSARCIIGFPRLAERSNMSESGARLAANGLIKKGLVRKAGVVFGKNREQGIEWEVFGPPALIKFRASRGKGHTRDDGPSRSAPIKESVLFSKEHTQTQAGASVGSRFSLEDCRRYADHLKQTGQGITNPGGYATKIFRSGEADALIEQFLKPQVDISKCPDCSGSGNVYLDLKNPDKGVKRCTHSKLIA